MTKYFLSFVEEFWPGQLDGTWIGRIEYCEVGKEDMFAEEVGIGTHDRDAVERLREKYDFKTVGEGKFSKLKRKVSELNKEA